MAKRVQDRLKAQGLLSALCLLGFGAVAACDTMLLPGGRNAGGEETAASDDPATVAVPETEVSAQAASAPDRAKPSYANTISERLITLARLRASRPLNPYAVEVAGPQTLPAEAVPAQASNPGGASASDVTFIVKIRDKAVQEEIARSFRKDRDGAVARWRDWRAVNGWDGFDLVGGSYSGEIILRLADDAAPALRERFAGKSAREVAAWISDRPNVAYCDPNYTASVP